MGQGTQAGRRNFPSGDSYSLAIQKNYTKSSIVIICAIKRRQAPAEKYDIDVKEWV